MGVDCSTCCTTAEEGKSEINDVNNDNIRVAPNLQKHANSKTSSNQVSSHLKSKTLLTDLIDFSRIRLLHKILDNRKT